MDTGALLEVIVFLEWVVVGVCATLSACVLYLSFKKSRAGKREADDVAEQMLSLWRERNAGGETLRQWGDRLLAQEYDNLPTIPGCD